MSRRKVLARNGLSVAARAIPLLAITLGPGPVAAGSTRLGKAEDPVITAPPVISRVQPRLCRDPNRPEMALSDHVPDPLSAHRPEPLAPPPDIAAVRGALDALPLFDVLPLDDPRRLVLLSWRAEFLAEQQRLDRAQARALQEERCLAEERGDEARAARLLTRQLEIEQRERRTRQQAIELFRIVADLTPPTSPQREQALLSLAFLLSADRRGAEARGVAERLLKEHPRSRLVPYAHLILAESLFDRGTASR